MWFLEDGRAVGISELCEVCRERLGGVCGAGPAHVRLLMPGFRKTKRRRLAGLGSPFGDNGDRAGYLQVVEFDAAEILEWLEAQGSDEQMRDRAFEGH